MKVPTIRLLAVASICTIALLVQGCNPAARGRLQNDKLFKDQILSGSDLLDHGRKAQALKALEKAIAAKPNEYESYITAASLLMSKQMFSESIPVLRMGIDHAYLCSGVRNPEAGRSLKCDLYQKLGYAHWQLGRFEDSEKAYRMAMQTDPKNPSPYNDLGYMYADKNIKLDEALRLTRRALELDPGNGMILDSVGWAYFRLGDKVRSLGYLRKAVELCPSDAEVRVHLGEVYESCGKPHAALIEYSKALTLSASNSTARLHRRILMTNLSKK